MRLVDLYDSFTLNECNGTGYSLAFGGGFIDVYDPKGKPICQFWGGDAPTITPESLRPKGEWISVEDRLPKSIINKVLVHCKNGYIGFGHYEEFKGNKDWYNLENGKPFTEWDLEDCETYEVTHWMPLPGPPGGVA